ncbi:MAG: glycosyltransferase family 2 protein [Verrucomicrobia bacterium]|nr:glycosyltransferase family 2 protein [Verrucomicrobiota bacterium]
MTTLSIVIPVYNSEATIERLCDAVVEEMGSSYRLQLVLVNDGSRDGSCAACQRLRERYPDMVDYISLTRNFGEHNAVMAGLHYAEGDWCVIMDDDFQNPPSEVHKLVAKMREGYDVVYTRYESKKHTAFRNLGSRLHNWMATRALGKPADLYLSSFKILSKFMVQQIIRYTGPDPYMDAIILRVTRNVGVVTVQHEERTEGKSGYSLGKLVSLWGNMFVAFSLYPLRLVALLGVCMALLGIFYGSYTFVAWLLPWIEEPGDYQKLDASNWFFRGLMLLAIGIVGEYVGRNYMHVNSDPQFIVRDVQMHRPQDAPHRSDHLASLRQPSQRPHRSHEQVQVP